MERVRTSWMKVVEALFWVFAGWLIQIMATASVFAVELPPTVPTMVIGTNLVLNATVPPDLQPVILEMRRATNNSWEEVAQSDVPSNGAVWFTIPKPSDAVCFFRLRATPKSSAANRESVSSEAEYVATPSLLQSASGAGAIFHFKGMVDGSDKILITHNGALWSHINWGWPPGPVTINKTKWTPVEKNYLTTVGAIKFLPDTFSLDGAVLRKISGRDVIALEHLPNALAVYLDDTLPGADEYEFEIQFPPGQKVVRRPAKPAVWLKISGKIDGSDSIRITGNEAVWEHKSYALPQDVVLNGVHWDVSRTNVLKNEGATAFLPHGVDFSTARIERRKGRDLATACVEKGALLVAFADNPNGSDDYELVISFEQGTKD